MGVFFLLIHGSRNWAVDLRLYHGVGLSNMILGGWGQQVDTTVLGLSAEEAVMKPYIASMGIYVFKKDVLLKLLRYPTSHASFLLQILHLCVPHIVCCSCCLLDLGNVIVMEDMNSLWKFKTMIPVVPAMHMVLWAFMLTVILVSEVQIEKRTGWVSWSIVVILLTQTALPYSQWLRFWDNSSISQRIEHAGMRQR
jgi:hypothetical protein